jgi:ferrous iron transport protein A
MSEAFALSSPLNPPELTGVRPLATAGRGDRGVIVKVTGVSGAAEAVAAEELERRLLEMGFVEGASIEVLHDALRRREAAAVTVKFDGR